MRKALPLILIIFRSNDNWIVGEVWGEKMVALLKAPVSVDPNQPPSTGWQFNNNGKFEKDESLICTNQAELPCSSITVSLSGETKEREWYCEGKYESTGLISMGREVNIGYQQFFSHFNTISLAGVQSGWKGLSLLCEAWRDNLVCGKQIE